MSELVVRPIGRDDLAPLGALDRATWSPGSSPGPRPEGDFDVGPTTRVLVAERAGELAGFVQHRPPTPLEANAHVRLINGLAVAPAHRGAGVARTLVEAALADIAALGATRVRLHVLGPNAAARALYASCGFVAEGVLHDEFLLDGVLVDDILMARPARLHEPVT